VAVIVAESAIWPINAMTDRETRLLDWRRLLPALNQTSHRLRQLLLGGALASVGLIALPRGAQGAEAPRELPLVSSPPTISERGKRTARLVLALPGVAKNLLAQHRSHSSHSSHRSHSSHSSHYSGSGGSSSGVALPVAPPPSPEIEPNTIVGTIEKIDRSKRLLSLRTSAGLRELAYRDDTQFEIVAGMTVRLDEYLEAHPNSFPVAQKERVRIKWRTTTATSNQIATEVRQAKP
jgi:hypothetical protein